MEQKIQTPPHGTNGTHKKVAAKAGVKKKSFKLLPYYETKSVTGALAASSKRRGQSRSEFVFKKLKNFMLAWMAYYCPANSWRVRFHRWRGVNIGENVFIGMQCILDHSYPEYLYLEDDVCLSGEVSLVAHSIPFTHFKGKLLPYVAPITIKRGAWLGVGTRVLPNITVGEASVVSAGGVVYENVPDHVIVRGNPAVVWKEL